MVASQRTPQGYLLWWRNWCPSFMLSMFCETRKKQISNNLSSMLVPCWLVSQKSRFPWWLDAPPYPYSEYHPLWLVYDQDTFSRIPDSFLWFCIHLYDPHLFGRDVRENSVHSTSHEETYNLEVEAYHVRTFHVTSKTTQFFTLPHCPLQWNLPRGNPSLADVLLSGSIVVLMSLTATLPDSTTTGDQLYCYGSWEVPSEEGILGNIWNSLYKHISIYIYIYMTYIYIIYNKL